ncbi:hypothetical protein [Burkholderia ubonensis]|uniref:hypothetical protein n=1 Tax=Burkholderia ubonensis TaxID=101571 RepID=UPI00075AB359|nr:hypothetical protein [Burkholderia ubonensis]KVP65298.1 hypothetical protein WJ93_24610 [Burkholderia ubonensis]
MIRSKRTTFIAATTLASVLALTSCAHRPKPVRAPASRVARRPAVDADAANPDRAKLVFTTSGMPMIVLYSISTAIPACEGFEPVGKVFDSGRSVLLPWIARFTEKTHKLLRAEISRQKYVEPGVTLQVQGGSGPTDELSPRYWSCGPIVTVFTPEKGRTYSVNFNFQGTASCSQRVTDITDPAHPVPVGQGLQCKIPRSRIALAGQNKNFLQAEHEQRLADAQRKAAAAASAADKADALQQEAAALDSLGRSNEALTAIDQALQLAGPSVAPSMTVTRAKILFSLNDPQATLNALAPEIEKTRRFASGKPEIERPVALSAFSEGFVTAAFAHAQLGHWKEAISTLADAHSPLEGPSFYAYRSLVYRYLMARAHDSSLANARLEQDATYYATHDKSHYSALLRMWQGDDTTHELVADIHRMVGTEEQEADSEAYFYRGAYMKFVKGDEAMGRAMLQRLDSLAPYGSIEWIYGKRVLN